MCTQDLIQCKSEVLRYNNTHKKDLTNVAQFVEKLKLFNWVNNVHQAKRGT